MKNSGKGKQTGLLGTALAACALMLPVVIASGCGNRLPYFAILNKSQSFLMSGVVNNKVDILWVIDNSGSMGPKQTNLATSINSFMSQFQTKGLDYHIAVVTTDTRATPTGQDSCFVGTTKVITNTTPSAATVLATNAQVGHLGDTYAKGIDAADNALSAPRVSGCNAGFLRADAFLVVVFFSDSDDNDSTITKAQLLADLDAIKPAYTTDAGTKVRPYFISAMTVQDVSSTACQALLPFPAAEVGQKFLDLQAETRGAFASICEPDFSSGLLSVSTKILEATTAVQLTRVPDLSTVEITLNGANVVKDDLNGWSYETDTNRIFFHGSAIPVGAGVVITVDYTPADVVR